jgi:hypothetical protein
MRALSSNLCWASVKNMSSAGDRLRPLKRIPAKRICIQRALVKHVLVTTVDKVR